MNNTRLARLFGASIIAATIGLGCLFLFSGGDASAQPTRQPFGNAVQQRAEMIRELKETNALLKEQNALLRQIVGEKTDG
jgi:hypothetical protein